MLVVLGLSLVSSPAFAKGTHHCVKDKKEISVKGESGKARKVGMHGGGWDVGENEAGAGEVR